MMYVTKAMPDILIITVETLTFSALTLLFGWVAGRASGL